MYSQFMMHGQKNIKLLEILTFSNNGGLYFSIYAHIKL